MIEWLTGDPLNGIAITIGFFISLIIGRYLRIWREQNTKGKIIDRGNCECNEPVWQWREQNTRGKIIDSRIKILISFLLITAITVMNHWYIPIVISALCIVFAAKLKIIRGYGKKLIFPLVLALFILVTQSFTYGVNTVNLGIISVYSEGLNYGFLIFSRVFASSSILLLLVITISENELLDSMRYFGVPKTMLEISSFMARYIKTFSSEGKKLKLAQESRCGFPNNAGFTRKMHNVASIIGALITHAFARSEEVYRAMLSRGWKPELKYSIDSQPLNKRDLFLGIMLSSLIFVSLGLDRLVL